jgi:hypothetical protein
MHKSNDRRVAFGPPRAYWAKTLDNFRELTPALEAAIEEIWKFPDYPESGPDCMQAKYLTMILAGPTERTAATTRFSGGASTWAENSAQRGRRN